MKILRAVPALPVRNMKRSIDFYCNKLGLTLGYAEDRFVVLRHEGERIIHLWEASDESWRTRGIGAGVSGAAETEEPVISGAESFIAGTASCRIEVEGIDELYNKLKPLGIVHPNAPLSDKWWGERDFGITDPDNNLIEFYEKIKK